MEKTGFLFFIILLIQANLLAQALGEEKRCEIKQTCPIPGICECTMTPSAFERNYYFIFEGIKRGMPPQHTCKLDSSPENLIIMLDGCSFPEGATYECVEECPKIPAKIILHTEQMVQEESSMTIKVRAPAPTDIPTHIQIHCNQE